MFIKKKKPESKEILQDFNSYVLSCYKRLYRAAWYYTANHDDAEDLVQETFRAAYKSFGSFKGGSAFYTWLYGIFRNILHKHNRRKKMFVSRFGNIEEGISSGMPYLVSADNPELLLEHAEQHNMIHRALSELPEKYSEILILRHFEEFSYDEIAGVLNCSTGTVKSRIYKARRLLRKNLR